MEAAPVSFEKRRLCFESQDRSVPDCPITEARHEAPSMYQKQ